VGGQDKHITNPTNYGTVGHHAGKANLLIALIHPKTEAVLDRFAHLAHGSAYCPMGGGIKEVMDHSHIQFRFIGADGIFVSLPLHGFLFMFSYEIESNMESILENLKP
jgi:hypothetical protein